MANIMQQAVDQRTAAWVRDRDDWMHGKLADVGLIPPGRMAKPAALLGPFLDEYLAKRIDVKPATKEVWSQVVRNLMDHFGAERDLATIAEGDAEDFKTVPRRAKAGRRPRFHKRLQFARMFFRAAKKRKLIADNPFAEVSAKAVMRQDRQRFITREETDRLLAVCNPTWRVIVALSRYGGLRCPSEVLSLRWRMSIGKPAASWCNRPRRNTTSARQAATIPLFAELRPILDEAFDVAPDGAEYVVDGNHREAANTASGWRNCNLRTQFERIVKRAGLTPGPGCSTPCGQPAKPNWPRNTRSTL